MANTYSQLYIQIVFAVRGRQNLIPHANKEELQKYITGIVQKRKHKMLAVHSMPDHTHIFVGLKPYMAIADLTRDIKSISSGFIKEKKWVRGDFDWQDGYGAFSYNNSDIDRVVKYILNQEEHHKKTSFREEYLKLLQEFDIGYNEKYLFEWIE